MSWPPAPLLGTITRAGSSSVEPPSSLGAETTLTEPLEKSRAEAGQGMDPLAVFQVALQKPTVNFSSARAGTATLILTKKFVLPSSPVPKLEPEALFRRQ